jgi:hypothetical protein
LSATFRRDSRRSVCLLHGQRKTELSLDVRLTRGRKRRGHCDCVGEVPHGQSRIRRRAASSSTRRQESGSRQHRGNVNQSQPEEAAAAEPGSQKQHEPRDEKSKPTSVGRPCPPPRVGGRRRWRRRGGHDRLELPGVVRANLNDRRIRGRRCRNRAPAHVIGLLRVRRAYLHGAGQPCRSGESPVGVNFQRKRGCAAGRDRRLDGLRWRSCDAEAHRCAAEGNGMRTAWRVVRDAERGRTCAVRSARGWLKWFERHLHGARRTGRGACSRATIG